MTIKEIELNNFRIYKGSNLIDLSNIDDKNIFVVSGRNGFGKTTFLMSLVWCLYGRQMQDVDDIYKKEIDDQGGYGKYIGNSLNRLAKSEDDYNFHVSITFTNVNIPEVPCKEIRIKRSYNAKTSSSEDVEVLIDGYPSEIAKEVGPEIFIREFIMPIEIAKFFFFDAEKIVSLAEVNTPEQKRKLSKAYSEVLGIKKYEDLKGELEGLQLKLRQDTASATEKSQLRILEAEHQNCDDKIKDNETKIAELREKRSEKNKESRDIQEKLIKSGSLITVEELHELRNQEEELTKRQNELQNQLKESYDIIPFAIAGEKFLEVNDQLENETNFKAAKFKDENVKGVTNKILTDLTKEPKPEDLVIDYKVERYFADAFEKLIRKHFFSDTPDLPTDFKMLLEFSDSEKNELQALLNNIKYSFKESFKRITSEYNQTRNDLNSIRKKIRDAETNQESPMITEFRNQKELLDKEIIGIDATIDSLNREIGEFINERTQKGKRIEELSKKLNVSEKNKAKDELITRNIGQLKDFIEKFKSKKKESLEKQILEGLETLLHKKGFVKKVEVEIIGDTIDIVLKNVRGEEIKKESLSKGEQQMYATALLRALVEESDIQFPVFIDSPMQKFDEQHAENIVKYFYPNISDQVVIFPLINKELTEKEYNILSNNIAKTFLINNIHEDKSEFLPLEPKDFISTYNKMYNNAN
ncbi:DNA sulfur modification protein DndD [Flavobacterium indicum GPTSA100-9 = DSM 17447]|uniref:DNA sulfur modification protein DndD n=1 Tax=Flavobacterium indicum (strain DSM 17447 / CIP 109464 / GPTSA100-9) TaxID=1094466 RepID=H8XTY6_FLAIG|nr:DNA sulfur modification protein DndD [Flavobacterium indicum]CCG53716.1 DNA sulfur modification protein DndD [Flavobacterium indicum GPTSA100-9 = DSM 17447]